MSPHSDDITPKSRIRFESRRIPAGPESPTPYPCTQAVMSDLQLPHGSPLASDSLPRLSLRAAVERLESFHAPSRPRSSSPGELLALLQLRDRLPALRDQDASSEHSCAWHADVAHKVFPDLDHALFEGVLQGKVCLTWETEEEQHERHLRDERKLVGKSAVTHIQHGRTVRPGQDARIWIRLNANVLLLDARKTLTDVISVLVHEMVHAYFILVMGHPPLFRGPETFHETLVMPGSRFKSLWDVEREELVEDAIAAVRRTLSRSVGFGFRRDKGGGFL